MAQPYANTFCMTFSILLYFAILVSTSLSATQAFGAESVKPNQPAAQNYVTIHSACTQILSMQYLSEDDYRRLRRMITTEYHRATEEEHGEWIFEKMGVTLSCLRRLPPPFLSGITDEDLRVKEDLAWMELKHRNYGSEYALAGINVLEFSNGDQMWLDFLDHAIASNDLLNLMLEIGVYKIKIHALFPELTARAQLYQIVPLMNRKGRFSLEILTGISSREFSEQPFGFMGTLQMGYPLFSLKIKSMTGVEFDEVFPDGLSGEFAKLQFYLLNLGYRFAPGDRQSTYFSEIQNVDNKKREIVIAAIRKLHELGWVYVPKIYWPDKAGMAFGVLSKEQYVRTLGAVGLTYFGEKQIVRARMIDGLEMSQPWAEIVEALKAKGFVYSVESKTWIENKI